MPSLLLLTAALLPYSGAGWLDWGSLFSASVPYALHPVSLFALAFPASRGIAHAQAGNLLLAVAFAGAQGCRAPLAAALAWLLFTLHHSAVQGACLALPLARWLWWAAAQARRQRGGSGGGGGSSGGCGGRGGVHCSSVPCPGMTHGDTPCTRSTWYRKYTSL
jgi:uncharacterized membrane protein YgcG